MSPNSRNTEPKERQTVAPGVDFSNDDPFVRGRQKKSLVLKAMNTPRTPKAKQQDGLVEYTFFDDEQNDIWSGIKSSLRIKTKQRNGFKSQDSPKALDESQSMVVSGNFGNFYISDDDVNDVVTNSCEVFVTPQKVMTSLGKTHGTFTFKVLVIGDPCAGKTSLIHRYVDGEFAGDYKATLGVDFALKVVRWSDNVTMKLQLWDIAGQERFTSMTRVYYKDAHACVIMFDLSQRGSFLNALKWKKDLDMKVSLPDGNPVPCILLANKCDLSNREVDQIEIEAFCQEQQFIGWTETSVKEGLMVEESMRFLLDDMIARYAERNPGMTDSQALDLDRRSNIYLRKTSSLGLGLKENCAC